MPCPSWGDTQRTLHCESLCPVCSHILLKTTQWAKVWLFPQPKGFHIPNSQVLFSPMTNSVFSLTAITQKHHLTLSHERIMSYCKYFNKLHSRKWISSSVFTNMGVFWTVTNEIRRLAINTLEAHTEKEVTWITKGLRWSMCNVISTGVSLSFASLTSVYFFTSSYEVSLLGLHTELLHSPRMQELCLLITKTSRYFRQFSYFCCYICPLSK